MRWLPLLLLLCGCAAEETPENVHVPCGGFTMAGAYHADVYVATQFLDADGNPNGDQAVDEAQMIVNFGRTGCATTMLGLGFHSGADALEVNHFTQDPQGNDWEVYWDIWFDGRCNFDECYISSRFDYYIQGERQVIIERDWILQNFEATAP